MAVAGADDMFYGDRNARVRDVAGNTWWIATRQEDLIGEALAVRARAGGKHLLEAQSACNGKVGWLVRHRHP